MENVRNSEERIVKRKVGGRRGSVTGEERREGGVDAPADREGTPPLR